MKIKIRVEGQNHSVEIYVDFLPQAGDEIYLQDYVFTVLKVLHVAATEENEPTKTIVLVREATSVS